MTRAISKKLEPRDKRGNISWHRHQPRPYGWATESLFLSASISTFWEKFNGTGRKDVNFSTHCRTTRRLGSLTYIFKKCWWKRSISEPQLLLYEEWSANENVETTPCSHRRGVGCPVVQYQMIVPKTYRPDVLSTADETPLPGHLGVNKTCQRFLDHLYWLSLRRVVAQYCKSFHTC